MSPATTDLWSPHARRERYWLHALLLFLTLLTTSAVGSRLQANFVANRPAILEDDLLGAIQIIVDPASLVHGLPFSLTLLLILLAHEMGHYLTCLYYGIDASLPYFLPAPTLIGTLGAFIRIRSAIWTRRQLFDVGVAGPVAGFAVLIPALAIGLAYSKILPGIAERGELTFSTPGILRILEWMIFPGVAASDIYLHPMARAAWVGVLATALNLLPIGQLDGGHILYSFAGERHRVLTLVFIAILLPLGWLYWTSWFFWAALLFLFGRKHPRIYDAEPMSAGRRQLGVLAVIIFFLSFSLAPIQ
ncbi:MAG TPA: site-2 protease family protein [Bryobacteraceae bacterium]|nr:site-2 protease family protein [Bryobacteraceae bacterium]